MSFHTCRILSCFAQMATVGTSLQKAGGRNSRRVRGESLTIRRRPAPGQSEDRRNRMLSVYQGKRARSLYLLGRRTPHANHRMRTVCLEDEEWDKRWAAPNSGFRTIPSPTHPAVLHTNSGSALGSMRPHLFGVPSTTRYATKLASPNFDQVPGSQDTKLAMAKLVVPGDCHMQSSGPYCASVPKSSNVGRDRDLRHLANASLFSDWRRTWRSIRHIPLAKLSTLVDRATRETGILPMPTIVRGYGADATNGCRKPRP